MHLDTERNPHKLVHRPALVQERTSRGRTARTREVIPPERIKQSRCAGSNGATEGREFGEGGGVDGGGGGGEEGVDEDVGGAGCDALHAGFDVHGGGGFEDGGHDGHELLGEGGVADGEGVGQFFGDDGLETFGELGLEGAEVEGWRE